MGCWHCSAAGSCSTLCDPMDCSTPGFPVLRISRSLLKLMSTESVMPSNHLILCHPLLLLPSIFPSIRVFSVSVLHIRWPKYWSFSTSSSNKYSGLISFRINWFDLLAVQGTLKSLLQNHCLKASIPSGSDSKKICLQCRRPSFSPWVREIPWRKEWQATPVFLPGQSHGQRSLVGYSPGVRKEWDMTEQRTRSLTVIGIYLQSCKLHKPQKYM